MADVCTVVSSYVTLMACIANPVCAPERGDGKILCGPPSLSNDMTVSNLAVANMRPVESCNRTITNYRCTRVDGSIYDWQDDGRK